MSKRILKTILVTLLLTLATTSMVFAAWTPEDFSAFLGTGFIPSPTAGELDSDAWRVTGLSDGAGTFGGTHTTGDFARGTSTGGVSTGGVYAFDVTGSANYILGVQPGGSDFTPGAFTLKVQNTTGSTLTAIFVSYTVWVYNDQPRSNSLGLYYSTDDSTYTATELSIETPDVADESPSWQATPQLIVISGLSIADGADFYLQWQGDDVSGRGSRDEYGIDDVQVRVADASEVTFAQLAGGSTFTFGGLAAAFALAAGLVALRKPK